AQHEQRAGERHLHARQAPDPPDEEAHGSRSRTGSGSAPAASSASTSGSSIGSASASASTPASGGPCPSGGRSGSPRLSPRATTKRPAMSARRNRIPAPSSTTIAV